jgi:hypothetical protein
MKATELLTELDWVAAIGSACAACGGGVTPHTKNHDGSPAHQKTKDQTTLSVVLQNWRKAAEEEGQDVNVVSSTSRCVTSRDVLCLVS